MPPETHPTDATMQEKMKRISLKCSQSLPERLGCSFCVVVKYSLQIGSVLASPKTLLPTVSIGDIFHYNSVKY